MNEIHSVNEKNFLEEREIGKIEVQKKFDAWDKLGKLNIPIDEFKKKTAYMWRDPTVWAYSTLRDKQNKPLEPFYYQDKLMNDRHRFIHITAANQIGKTWSAGIIKGLHHATFTNNASVMLISRSEDQAKGILDEMKWMLKRAKISFDSEENEISNRFEYHLESPDGVGTSVIRVFPPTPSILSFPATMILMDETGFWKKDGDMDPIAYYQQCVEPRTNNTKNWSHPFLTMGQIVSITNPNGQDGLAWWLRNNLKFHQYTYNWLANPLNTIEEYLEAKRDLPTIRFASVYAAEYLLASGGFIELNQYTRFSEYKVNPAIGPGFELYLGGDLASEDPKSKGTDWNSLYGVIRVPNKDFPQNPRVRVVYDKRWPPRTKREVIYKEIDRLNGLEGVRLIKFAYDRVGVGESVKRDLINRGILYEGQIEDLPYSLPNKSEVYLCLQALFQQDMIEGYHIPELQEQILALKVEQPVGSAHIKVHHKTEGVKDDDPDALANACYVAKKYSSFTRSAFVKAKPVKTQRKPKNFMEYLRQNSMPQFV